MLELGNIFTSSYRILVLLALLIGLVLRWLLGFTGYNLFNKKLTFGRVNLLVFILVLMSGFELWGGINLITMNGDEKTILKEALFLLVPTLLIALVYVDLIVVLTINSDIFSGDEEEMISTLKLLKWFSIFSFRNKHIYNYMDTRYRGTQFAPRPIQEPKSLPRPQTSELNEPRPKPKVIQQGLKSQNKVNKTTEVNNTRKFKGANR